MQESDDMSEVEMEKAMAECGKCARLEYIDMHCDRVPKDSIAFGNLSDVVPLDNRCIACMISMTHSDIAETLTLLNDIVAHFNIKDPIYLDSSKDKSGV